MSVQHSVTQNIEVKTQVTFVEAESNPSRNYFFFVYRISIKNSGSNVAQLISRHWIINDSFGRTEEVRGPGVVGLQPKIHAGQIFEYESACPLNAPSGSMKGSYQFQDESGQSFQVEIPEFNLISPQALH